jgi:hypothetical protein
MRTFNTTSAFALCSLFALAHASDEITLRGSSKNKLTGVVTDIEESGVIVLTSPLADEPFRLRPDTVERVRFGQPSVLPTPSSLLVELVNGDRLPVTLQSFTREGGMRISSHATGDLLLPTATLSSLEPGILERRLAFDGPGKPTDWTATAANVFDNVAVEGREWTVPGRLEAARQVEMPKNFSLRFQLAWTKNQQPNVKIHFASPNVSSIARADRYFIQFGGAGFEIKRENTNGPRFPSILVAQRGPESFANREVDVEVHVNRVTRRIELLIDGQPEAWGLDPSPEAPTGSGLILGLTSRQGAHQVLRRLTVHELDNTRTRHRAEDRGNPDKDSLIERDENRWAGELVEVRKSPDSTEFLFQTAHRPEPLEIPMENISTVFFRKPAKQPDAGATKYRLQLHGEGLLSVKSCRISEETITVVHPLLGQLELPKQSIIGIEPATATSEPEAKSE